MFYDIPFFWRLMRWYRILYLIKLIFIALIPTIIIPAIIVGFVINYFGLTIDSLLVIIFLGQFYIIWAQLEVALRQTRLSTLEYEPEFKIEIKKSSEASVADDERIMEGYTYFPYDATLKNVGKHLARNVRAEINIFVFKPYFFSWDNVPGIDSEKLLRCLRDDFDIVWAKNAEILKSDDGKIISISKDENSAEIIIDEKKERATLKISYAITHELKVKKENGKLNIYFKPTYRNIKPIVKPFGDIGADKSHFVYGFMEEDLKNNEVTIKFKYQNILGESGSVGFISEPEFCEFIGVERVKMPGILLNSFEMLFSSRKRI
jgi:hypothetical protein